MPSSSASEQIQRCRRLAMATSDERLIKALDEYAAELEQGVAPPDGNAPSAAAAPQQDSGKPLA